MTKARDLADNSQGTKPKVVDAKGDLMAASTADTVVRVALGDNGQYLKVDTSTTSGLAWSAVSGDNDQFILAGQVFG
jgi:hypothetical protein